MIWHDLQLVQSVFTSIDDNVKYLSRQNPPESPTAPKQRNKAVHRKIIMGAEGDLRPGVKDRDLTIPHGRLDDDLVASDRVDRFH